MRGSTRSRVEDENWVAYNRTKRRKKNVRKGTAFVMKVPNFIRIYINTSRTRNFPEIRLQIWIEYKKSSKWMKFFKLFDRGCFRQKAYQSRDRCRCWSASIWRLLRKRSRLPADAGLRVLFPLIYYPTLFFSFLFLFFFYGNSVVNII
jgi:hypothetical protein